MNGVEWMLIVKEWRDRAEEAEERMRVLEARQEPLEQVATQARIIIRAVGGIREALRALDLEIPEVRVLDADTPKEDA